MSATYEKAPKDITDLVATIMDRYEEHHPLVSAGVVVDVLMASGKEMKDGTVSFAIKVHGVRALGCIKRNGLKERVLGHGDATMLLDADWWHEAGPEEHAALIDHELYHLSLKLDDTGEPEQDDASRPKLVLRPHSHEFGWFDVVAARHGPHSQERIQFKRMCEASGQSLMPEVFNTAFPLPQPSNNATDVLPQDQHERDELIEESVTITSGGGSVTMPFVDFKNASKTIAAKARQQASGA